MINILKLELKRMLKNKNNILILSMGLVLTILLITYVILIQSTNIIDSTGSYKTISGLKAVKYDAEIQNKLEGEVTNEILLDTLNRYTILYSKYGENIPLDIYTEELGAYMEFINILPYSFSNFGNRMDNQETLTIDKLTEDEVSNYYTQLSKNQSYELINYYKLPEKAQNYAKNMDNKVKKPFYFSSFTGWDTVLEFSNILIICICILGCILIANVYSKEYKNGSDDIMRCTKYGKKHLAISKLISSNLLASLLYIICMTLFYGIAYALLNRNGLKTSIQFLSPLSPVPLTFEKCIFIIIIFGLITVLSMVNFTLFLSSKYENSTYIISLALIVLLAPIFIRTSIDANLNNASNIIKFLVNILPSSGTRIYYELINELNLFQIGSLTIWSPYIILATSVLILIFFSIFTVKSYINHEAI